MYFFDLEDLREVVSICPNTTPGLVATYRNDDGEEFKGSPVVAFAHVRCGDDPDTADMVVGLEACEVGLAVPEAGSNFTGYALKEQG